MIKSEMSLQAQEDRQVFVQLLSDAGWRVQDWAEALDAGADVEPEAEAQYGGPVFDLLVEYHARDRILMLEIVQRYGPVVLSLQLHPKGDLAPLLARIIEAQEKLNEETYTDFVKSLIPLCSLVLIETDEGTYRLT